jgi:amino acid adenylation domain-containing protein
VKPETIEDQQLKNSLPNASAASVLQMVEERSRKNPDALAVLGGGSTLTYGELNSRANRMAHRLLKSDVGRDRVVGIYLERSPASVVAALAIFKAGAAYLPLDPSLPEQRLAFMLEDAKASAVVSTSILSERLPAGRWNLISSDEFEQTSTCGCELPKIEASAQDVAYVIYTSGSTGQPKGVEVTQGNLMNLVSWHLRAFQVTAADRAALQSAPGFDAAVWELWPYLACGASVAVADESVRNNPEAMRDWLLSNKITIAFLATAMAERMLSLAWPKQTSLRILLTGADTLRRRPAKNAPFVLVNNYGPTECTVVATSGSVAADSSAMQPSIGRAIDNTVIHILDSRMCPVRHGESGELYIGGAGVARGYRNNPVLTAERFVRDPFLKDPDARLYRTGDLGRLLANGEIEFLGRLDEQIKIRGFRIEPGEIVTALNSFPGVRASAVSLLGADNWDKRLAAYLVLDPDANVTVSRLRDALSKKLPEYMVPSVYKSLPSLPLTRNGKIDYAALPVHPELRPLPESEFVAPETLVERRLAAILVPLLRVERVSTKDNFFLLGGHSLLGTQLITKIKESFDVDLSLLSLFDHPTLEEMSVEVENLILAKIASGNGSKPAAPHIATPGSQ